MKAAVLIQLGETPVYTDLPDPVPQNDQQLLLEVKAAALKNLDKLRTQAGHYVSYRELPAIIGNDGVGLLADGTPVYAQGLTGMMAQKAIISTNRYTVLPQGINLALAAALPNAVIGSTLALQVRAGMKPGDVILINGATGVTGQLAVQVARYYGASKIIATGRNEETLNSLGADTTILLTQPEETIRQQLKEAQHQSPIDIVIDYLWGRPTELLIQSLQIEGINPHPHKTKILTVGDMAGPTISLTSGSLRSADIEVIGSGLGTYLPKDLALFSGQILPAMFALAASGQLTLAIQKEQLANISLAWHSKANGKRIVVTMD